MLLHACLLFCELLKLTIFCAGTLNQPHKLCLKKTLSNLDPSDFTHTQLLNTIYYCVTDHVFVWFFKFCMREMKILLGIQFFLEYNLHRKIYLPLPLTNRLPLIPHHCFIVEPSKPNISSCLKFGLNSVIQADHRVTIFFKYNPSIRTVLRKPPKERHKAACHITKVSFHDAEYFTKYFHIITQFDPHNNPI